MEKRKTIERYYQSFRERDRQAIREITTADMRHVSSYAEYRDRDAMLEAIWPTVGQSWATAIQIFGDGPEFMVRYRVESSDRPAMNMAEYIRFDGDRIAEIEVYLGRPL